MEALYKKLMELTKYDTNPNIKLIIVHGSRVTSNTTNSDLDVFILTSEKKSYKEAHTIKGVKYDINIVSLDDLEIAISNSEANHNQYYHSILKTGIVMKNEDQALEFFENILNIHEERKTQTYLLGVQAALNRFLFSLESINNVSDRKHYYYYNLLEEIRKLYYIEKGISYISPCKVLDSYENPSKYIDSYCLKLPSNNFIEIYKRALSTESDKDRLQIVYELLDYLNERIELDEYNDSMDCKFVREVDEKLELIYINNMREKVIRMLRNNEPNAEAMYCILVERMRKLYVHKKKFAGGISNIRGLHDMALSTRSKKTQIEILNAYMSTLHKDIKIDFDDYKLEYRY